MVALIVPAYKPTQDMLPMVGRFVRETDYAVIVVDDGSGEGFAPVFDALPEGVRLLRHEVNRGKGAALKTAIGFILDQMPDCELAVTADADGQHRFEDILRVVEKAGERTDALVLGSRAFTGKVPFKSRAGNAITRQVFSLASGARVYDTQTGLRAFGRSAMEAFRSLPGDRYEYEINMLLSAARGGIPIVEVPIETVYIDDNSSSHFHPVKDSFRIYACIFRYVASSITAFLVDTLVLLLMRWLTGALPAQTSLLVSTITARVVSSIINFTMNKKLVFGSKGDWKREFLQYAVLVVVMWGVNYKLLEWLHLGLHWPLLPAQILVQCVLYVCNFIIQGKFIYNRKR